MHRRNINSKKWIPLILILLVSGIFWVRHKPYQLNRELRETALRLIQAGVLSRTTGLDYRIEFNKRGYSIAIKNSDSGLWETEDTYEFGKDIRCRPAGLRCYFVRGRFAGYEIDGGKGPRYILLHLFYPGDGMTRSLVFSRKGDWRAVG